MGIHIRVIPTSIWEGSLRSWWVEVITIAKDMSFALAFDFGRLLLYKLYFSS